MRKLLESAGVLLAGETIQLPKSCTSVRIDVGLSVNAPQSQVWLKKDPNLHVFGFEPVKANREKILKGNSPWPINLDPSLVGERIHILPCALLERHIPGGMDIFVTKKDPGCSSVLAPKTFEVDYIENVEVDCLDSFFEYFPFNQIAFIHHLKIDVQGADIQVLEGALRNITKILAVTVEVDTNEYCDTRNSLEAIHELLRPYGFELLKKGLFHRIKLRLKGIKVNVETDDPTFINIPLYKNEKPKDFWIYQRG